MTMRARRERERAERKRLIVTAARKVAEAEGWNAVTTRRLSSEVACSQPALYSHFKGKDAITAAVAVQGFAGLATALRAARMGAERGALAAVREAYTRFARWRPALYDAMFTLTVDLPFATAEAPAELQAAFGELRQAVVPMAGDGDDIGLLAETCWAGLRGLASLTRSGRLLGKARHRRLSLLERHFVA
ncbi:TetR/AcrR family transcriptional regulator [Streptomyces sp. HD1123-B1]|uniref:TetR/AcrR family transcriptional regulator n=1 Tax=Streptomyces huangiella TaxID=3228804 RepID=UPI003D7CD148